MSMMMIVMVHDTIILTFDLAGIICATICGLRPVQAVTCPAVTVTFGNKGLYHGGDEDECYHGTDGSGCS